jgi:hypothetical protein
MLLFYQHPSTQYFWSRCQNCSRMLHALQSQLLYLHTELIETLRGNFMTWHQYRSSRSLSMHRLKLLKPEIRRACIRRREPVKSKVGTVSQEIRKGHDISPDFTGISAPYEAPHSPEIHIKTHEVEVTEAVRIITEFLTTHGYL